MSEAGSGAKRRLGETADTEAALDAEIERVLAQKPGPAVSTGFAARVARAAAAHPAPRASLLPLRWGLSATAASAVVLLGMMFVVAAMVAHGAWSALPSASLETLCLCEFAAAVYGVARLGRWMR